LIRREFFEVFVSGVSDFFAPDQRRFLPATVIPLGCWKLKGANT
jgi:hypothetical protein